MAVTILSIASNRPDFIKLQYDSIKKNLQDDFYYVVVNNSYFKHDKPKQIEKICQEEGTGYARVHHKDGKTDISALMRDTLNFLWKEFKDVQGVLAIFDSDIFFTAPISFTELLEGYDMAFCPIYTAGQVWPWTGLMLFDMDKIKAEDMNFGFACLDGKKYSDVGSAVNGYVQKHNPKIRLLDRKEIMNEDWPVKDNATLSTLGFPLPHSIDIIRIYEQPFMFHYKTSSNYALHCTPKYNRLKTKALIKLL